MSSDYLEGRGRVRVAAAGVEIEGVSIAGHESFYKVPAFHALLDFGRAPEDTVSYANVFLTHGHLDHAAGLAHHASRRRLAAFPARASSRRPKPPTTFAVARRSRNGSRAWSTASIWCPAVPGSASRCGATSS